MCTVCFLYPILILLQSYSHSPMYMCTVLLFHIHTQINYTHIAHTHTHTHTLYLNNIIPQHEMWENIHLKMNLVHKDFTNCFQKVHSKAVYSFQQEMVQVASKQDYECTNGKPYSLHVHCHLPCCVLYSKPYLLLSKLFWNNYCMSIMVTRAWCQR